MTISDDAIYNGKFDLFRIECLVNISHFHSSVIFVSKASSKARSPVIGSTLVSGVITHSGTIYCADTQYEVNVGLTKSVILMVSPSFWKPCFYVREYG